MTTFSSYTYGKDCSSTLWALTRLEFDMICNGRNTGVHYQSSLHDVKRLCIRLAKIIASAPNSVSSVHRRKSDGVPGDGGVDGVEVSSRMSVLRSRWVAATQTGFPTTSHFRGLSLFHGLSLPRRSSSSAVVPQGPSLQHVNNGTRA